MGRESLFQEEPDESISGLVGLTQPSPDERVSAVIDIAVVGARSDGKTQFIAHAIRTLRAYAPADLSKGELRQNQDILQVVMNARDPRPEATVPGQVRHYTFRARAQGLLSGLGGWGRWRLLSSRGLGAVLATMAVVNALVVGGLVYSMRMQSPAWAAVSAAGALVVGLVLGYRLARWRFTRRGEVEVVFWDVAGEEVYSSSASGYYTFLSTLVQTRARQQPGARAYGFAPVLICNPMSLGTAERDSSYSRLRQLMPQFAALQNPQPPVLVAVNRWALVAALCKPGTRAEDQCAIVPVADDLDEDPDEDVEGGAERARDPLPIVKRNVVRRHCLDADRSEFSDTDFSTIHYDAGVHAEIRDEDWPGWAELDKGVRKRWAEVGGQDIDRLVHYRYAEGPGSFEGKTRKSFLRWLAAIPQACESHSAGSDRGGRGPGGRKRNTGELYVVSPVPEATGNKDEGTGGFRTGGT